MQPIIFSMEERNDIERTALPTPSHPINSHEDLRNTPFILFGAGGLGLAAVKALSPLGIYPEWAIDSNPEKWGNALDGVPIRSPDSLHEITTQLVIITSAHIHPILNMCKNAGVRNWTIFTDLVIAYGSLDYHFSLTEIDQNEQINKAFELFRHSPSSTKIFKDSLRCRITKHPQDFPPFSSGQYFQSDIVPLEYYRNFVDCGAYTGDTLETWIHHIDKLDHHKTYWGFEPNPTNFATLQSTSRNFALSKDVNLKLIPKAVGNQEDRAFISQSGSASHISADSTQESEIIITTIDNEIADQRISAIKMDLEGFEQQALQGSVHTILRNRPALLISVYHRTADIWEIPNWINKLD